MLKSTHEIRDPVHGFIRIDSTERTIVDSLPFQRLRHIHQLALSYLVYPGATHRRFEHSLGVMELATRIFDVVTNPENVHPEVRDLIPEIRDHDRGYWRNVLRAAALCHDIGHLAFSHAAEKDLLPKEWDHERFTRELVLGDYMRDVWNKVVPLVDPKHIAKLAVGPKHYPGENFTDGEAVLSEIIVGDAFGADRIDYLLRDSHHAGVAYGRFDHQRLIDTLRILPRGDYGSREPALGIEEGGVHSAEALLLARYFMFTQVYCHPVRRAYDLHLKEFLQAWLPGGKFSTDLSQHLETTDNEVTSALLDAARSPQSNGHESARRIAARQHFKVAYERNPNDLQLHPDPGKALYEATLERFGFERVRRDAYTEKGRAADFPVLLRDGSIASSLRVSEALNRIPVVAVDFVLVAPEIREEAMEWIKGNRERTLKQAPREED